MAAQADRSVTRWIGESAPIGRDAAWRAGRAPRIGDHLLAAANRDGHAGDASADGDPRRLASHSDAI